MRYEVTVEIDAPAERVWEHLIDVERWPEWTASMSRVELLGNKPFGPGSAVRIKQPKLPPAVWTVTGFVPGSAFTWVAKSPGVTTTALHELVSAPDGPLTVRLVLEQTGPLAPLFAVLVGRLSRRYLNMEAQGLKRRAESP
ncbi:MULTISPECIES: SRPBCC family protein [Thermomonospora]|uniref:Cyclase/dehydrase n=1 Tax=Thermomonospora curvata (strain ATCC 19995 / DSM 43183 / JCM 3096 / KCTC 9072 / NBRC 15933 / NCIMB 10081 / Henssen B9) TaxID=471852 RepID=D1AA90_THECD|nr:MULTISPECIES: SRPBCC family protein [Thermomonospora]ACY98803.1 cyclase/dehydrase [Thermomonospora curvata DSM 43183]PKK13013.1 MAG: polyketide cyclase [Thermomonospora sp. CIF 1]